MKIRFYLGILLLGTATMLTAQGPQAEKPIPEFVKEFSNLAEKDREQFGLLRAKAQEFFGQKRIFESLEKLHEAEKIFKNDPAIWNLRGACYVELRKFEEARESYQKALAIEENNLGVLFNLAEMDFVTARWEGGSEKFGNIVKKISGEVDGPLEGQALDLQRLALFKKMLCDYKLGKEDAAQKIAEDHWDDFDDTPFTYYSKAALALLEGDEETGHGWIRSAIRVFGSAQAVGNWQDTMIEIGLVKSFFGNSEDAAATE